MAKTNPIQFIQQVRSEVSKVTWPGRKEVMMTSVMVLALSTVIAIFFSIVDLTIRFGLQTVFELVG